MSSPTQDSLRRLSSARDIVAALRRMVEAGGAAQSAALDELAAAHAWRTLLLLEAVQAGCALGAAAEAGGLSDADLGVIGALAELPHPAKASRTPLETRAGPAHVCHDSTCSGAYHPSARAARRR
ncbi:MAG: hypothetical protein ACKVWR_02855 [Acidimicrobiales bacterium]